MSTESSRIPVAPVVPRRTLAKGLAWAVPAVTFATQMPAFAASSQCTPQIESFTWSDYTEFSSTSTLLTFTMDWMNVTGLPEGAVITGIKQQVIVQNRNGGTTGFVDPGNGALNETTCDTAYQQITGCQYTATNYPDTTGGLQVKPDTNAGGVPVAPMWDPDKGSARAGLTRNWFDETYPAFGSDPQQTLKAWEWTYVADVTRAPALTKNPTTGCMEMITKTGVTDDYPGGTYVAGQGGTPKVYVYATGTKARSTGIRIRNIITVDWTLNGVQQAPIVRTGQQRAL